MPALRRPVFWDKNGCKHYYTSPKSWETLAGFEDADETVCPAPEKGDSAGQALGDKTGGAVAPKKWEETKALEKLDKEGNAPIAPAGEVVEKIADV